ncbi:MAG TPA: hypothetical protein VHB98_17770 [Chloroflexota bacterium]|nr:hypothetical protein [Chloroflexota bacterium]
MPLLTPERGTQLWAAANTLRQALRTPRPPSEQAEHEHGLVAVRTSLGEEAFDAAWAAGQVMPLEEAIALALVHGPAT